MKTVNLAVRDAPQHLPGAVAADAVVYGSQRRIAFVPDFFASIGPALRDGVAEKKKGNIALFSSVKKAVMKVLPRLRELGVEAPARPIRLVGGGRAACHELLRGQSLPGIDRGRGFMDFVQPGFSVALRQHADIEEGRPGRQGDFFLKVHPITVALKIQHLDKLVLLVAVGKGLNHHLRFDISGGLEPAGDFEGRPGPALNRLKALPAFAAGNGDAQRRRSHFVDIGVPCQFNIAELAAPLGGRSPCARLGHAAVLDHQWERRSGIGRSGSPPARDDPEGRKPEGCKQARGLGQTRYFW